MWQRIAALAPNTAKKWLAWVLVFVVIYLANRYLGSDLPEPLPPSFGLQADGSHNFGWHRDPDAVKAVAQTLRFKTFADTPAGQAADPLPDHVFLWDAYRNIFGRKPPSRNQKSVGSCVSFGTTTAIERTAAADIAFGKHPADFKELAQEIIYGGSRVEIGGGRIRGDGSVGAWAAQFVEKYGVIARGTYTVNGHTYDLTAYDETRCRQFGQSGVPDDLEPLAREHPVRGITQVKSWDDAKRALSQGYGIAVCSNQGFVMQRDSRGVARPSGNWGHCMCFDGYVIENGQEFTHVENSWGPDAHTGPVGWGDPPTSGFWIEAAVAKKMIAAGDTWAFSNFAGFPRKKLDWFVSLPARDRVAGRVQGGTSDAIVRHPATTRPVRVWPALALVFGGGA